MKPLSWESFNVSFDNKKCLLTISRNLKELKFSLNFEDNLNTFEGNFSYEELIKLNNIFQIFNSIEEIEKSLKQAISENKLELIKVKDIQMNLNFKVNFLAKRIDIYMPLNQRKINEKEIIQILLKENKELKKEINNIKEENKIIKLTLDLMQKKISEFELLIKNKSLEDNDYFRNSYISVTKEQNELIVNRLKEVEQFRNKNRNNFQFNLLFRGTRDGDDSTIFHKLCDNKRNILVLLETTKNRKFGGFCSIGYKSSGDSQKDNSAFIFSLDKLKIYNVINNETAVYWNSGYGAMFGGSIMVVVNSFFSYDCFANSKNVYYQIPENFDYNGGESKYRIKEIEVYQIS